MNNSIRKRLGYVPGPTVDRVTVKHFVYRLHDAEGGVVYVGRSCNVANRIRAHRSNGKPWLAECRTVSMFGPMTWDEAVAAERSEVARLQPRGNIALTARDHRPAVAWSSKDPQSNPDGQWCESCGMWNPTPKAISK